MHAARRHTGLTTVSVGSATDLPYDDGYFDVVCALDIAEHLPDPGRLLAESSRVLRPGKLLVLSTPNPESLGHRLKGRGWHANGDESHIGIRPMNAWRALLAKYAFEIVRDGSDTMWDTPYVRWAPDRFQWPVFIGLAQAMWSIDVAFRWRLGENYVCFARKAAA